MSLAAAPPGADIAALLGARRRRLFAALAVLLALAVFSALLALASGAVAIAPGRVLAVLGDRIFGPGGAPALLLPGGAFLGGLAATVTLYAIATRGGRTAVATMLLGGVALGALAGALTGLLVYLSDDRQLRDLTFWSLGSLAGAGWGRLAIVAGPVLLMVAVLPFLARGLNALALGEAEAFHLGFAVQRLKAVIIVLVALAVGASVAGAGMIGFVGLVVPHLLRLTVGPDHRALLPFSLLAGGSLLLLADTLARSLAAPAEMPIGIVTAALGAPFFLWLLLRSRQVASL